MVSNQNLKLSLLIDSRFTKELKEIFVFEYDNRKKTSVINKMERIINGKSIQCNFKASGTSVLKMFNLWQHVKRNHPEI